MTAQLRDRKTPFVRTIGGLLALVVALLAGMPAASAQDCPGVSISFDHFQLLNDDYRSTAGPFAIELPAGDYDVTMVSFDAHDTHDQPTQLNEQWYFKTDSGYTSGLTIDIPLESNGTTTVLAKQAIGATTAVTLHHAGIDNVNSVSPVCIGFSPTQRPAPAADEMVGADDVVEDEVDTEVRGIVEESPETGKVPPADLERKPAVETTPTPAVIPQLAITGPSQAVGFTMVSFTLILLGAAMLHTSRRRASV